MAASIYEAASGAVMCSMVVDVGGFHMKGGICLIQKDGTLSERGFRDVQMIFGWSEWDWSKWDQEPEAFAGAGVQVVIETVQGDRGGEFSSIKYVNPPGGGQRLEKANARALAAKYGAKTRALFGGAAASTGPKTGPQTAGGSTSLTAGATPGALGKPTPPRPPATRPPPPPPERQIFTSTMEECWEVFCKKHEGKPELELYGMWADQILAETGKTQNDCGAEDWGRFMESMTADSIQY